MEIIYYAANDTTGDTPARDCDNFREWARGKLTDRYPDHKITVSTQHKHESCYTDDIDEEDGIKDFCYRLWDLCPWNF